MQMKLGAGQYLGRGQGALAPTSRTGVYAHGDEDAGRPPFRLLQGPVASV
jgi:hypothetical protein